MAANDLNPGIIKTPAGFHYAPVDFDTPDSSPNPPAAPLGVLSNFTGVFTGTGFNTIFRPNNGTAKNTSNFPHKLSGPPIPTPPNENVLELNLTTEQLTFAKPLGTVPNRGLAGQEDITLNGVPYVQTIQDVTNIVSGKADAAPTDIHFEPGLWMHVPATTNDPVLPASLVRMASIPHGTTINAQTVSPPISFPGPPRIDPVDITPFVINTTTQVPFPALTIESTDTPRLPQDLGPFIRAGTITKEILKDPNTVLRNAIAKQKIINTIFFEVSTNPQAPSSQFGGGTANIAFLAGTGGPAEGNNSGPAANADAVTMSAQFWIETVEHEVEIPVWQPGHPPIHFTPTGHTSQFAIVPPHAITESKTIKVHTTQIQYSQVVNLNFAKLTWPHVSVATLVPAAPNNIPQSAWK